MANAARELAVHMSHTGTEYWKALGRLIGYLKAKETKVIIVRNLMILKVFIFCYFNYAKDKQKRDSVSGLVATLGGTLLMCFSKTQRTVTLSTTKAEYVALSACAQEVKVIIMFMGEITEMKNPAVIYKDK